MGTYTQIKGFLEIDSELNYEEFGFDKELYIKNFEEIKKDFIRIWSGERAESATSTSVYNIGSDWEHFIFFGGSIKDYDSDLSGWIEFILNKYNCDGRIELLFENNEYPIILIIKDSKILIKNE